MMARQVLVEMARSFRLGAPLGSAEERLDHARFGHLDQELAEAGYSWDNSEAETLLAALRATYEPLLEALAAHLLMRLPGWMPDQDHPDHWERGPRGGLARQIVDELTAADSIAGQRNDERARRSGRKQLEPTHGDVANRAGPGQTQ